MFEDCINIPSPDPLTLDFQYPYMAPTRTKCPLTDITEVTNNGIQSTKKQRHSFGAKSGKCTLLDITEVANNGVQLTKKQRRLFGVKSGKYALLVNVNSSPYNFYPPP